MNLSDSMTKNESQIIEAYILQHFPMTNRQFSQALRVTIDVVKYHIKKLGLEGQRKRGRIRRYDELIRKNYPACSAPILVKKLGITPNTINRIARQIGIKHNPDFIKAPHPIKENLVGMKYGKLTVQKQLGTNKWGQMVYQCLCECGKITHSTAGNLKHNHAISCGCQRKHKQKLN